MWTWLEEHPYVLLYLVGCVAAALLSLVHLVIFGLIRWMTKTNTLNRNLNKILPPDERALYEKVATNLTAIALSVALSWINVLVVAWQILAGLLGTVRELFSSTPEAVKLLRFPLRNNPKMSREAVWAYVQALQIKLGQLQPGESELRASLDEVFGYYPSFDRAKALNKLKALNVLSGDAVSALAATVSDGDEPYIVDDDPWEYGGSHIELYPGQRKFVYKNWCEGESEEEYEYRVDPDCHLICRLRNAAETGIKFEEGTVGHYNKRHTVQDGVIIEDAVRFIYEDNIIMSPSKEITELSSKTEWHEITTASSWPELWYKVIKIHVGEDEARRGIRKELERLMRGLRIVTEQTRQRFTLEHDEKSKVSRFKPIDESTSDSSRTILPDALERSGLTLTEAETAHFRIKSLATMLGDAKEGNHESGPK